MASNNGGAAQLPDANADLGPTTDIITWTLVGLSGMVLGLRLWCKWRKHRGLWLDDHLLIVSWFLLVASGAVGTHNRSFGFGRHIHFVNPANFAALDLHGNLATVFSVLGTVWSKTSFAITLLRLMQTWPKKVGIWFIIITTNLALYTTVITTWFKCVPGGREQQCISSMDFVAYATFAGAYSAAMDFVLAFIPWPLIWSLQLKKKEKLGVAVAMSLGVIAGATATMKCLAIQTIAQGDFTYYGASLVIWGNAEVATTIMAASIPVLRVLFIQIKTSAERYYYDSHGNRTNGMSTGGKSANMKDADTRPKGTQGSIGYELSLRDDSSERSIIRAHRWKRGIVQTNEIKLEYHSARDDRLPARAGMRGGKNDIGHAV